MNWNPFTVLTVQASRWARIAIVLALTPIAIGGGLASVAQGEEQTKLLAEVHFDPGSTAVTPGGMKKIAQAIAKIKTAGPQEIRVIGFTDSTGGEALNQAIARKRADNVASLLAEQGITVPLVIEGKGETGAPYYVGDNISEPLNRCVGIIAVTKTDPEPLL